MLAEFESILSQYDPISLEQLSEFHLQLLDRVDTKFLMTEEHLAQILSNVVDRYRVLTIGEVRLHPYQTHYFDTPDFALYFQHHNDHLNRYKVRCRTYLDTGVSFMEVKLKTNRQRTVKSRMQVPRPVTELGGMAEEFVRGHARVDVSTLAPTIWTRFYRITLVSKRHAERLTLDLELRYGRDTRRGHLRDIAIAEVKQKKFSLASDFVQELRRFGIHRTGFSKYCIAMNYVYPFLKYNRFKRRDLLVQRLLRQRGCL